MSTGVTPEGFVRKSLDEIKTDLEVKYRNAFGDIRTDPQSVFGQIIGITADEISLVWETLENTYFSQYPSTAEDTALDNVLALNGLTRLEALPSIIELIVYRSNTTLETVLSSTPDFLVNSNSSDLFKLSSNQILADLETVSSSNTKSLYGLFVEIPSAEAVQYTITINGVDVSYAGQGTPTSDDIIDGLYAELQNLEVNGIVFEIVARTSAGGGTKTLHIKAINGLFALGDWTGGTDNSLMIGNQSCPFESIEDAVSQIARSEPFGTVQTPIGNINTTVDAFVDGIVGQETETDSDARLRRLDSLQVLGGATVDAIRANILQDVTGVTATYVLENDTMETIPSGVAAPYDNFPAKSIWCIVEGGADQDIADTILGTKSAGIQTFGEVGPIVSTDSQNINYNMFFSRPTGVPVYADVILTLDPEEDTPADVVEKVQESVVAYLNSLEISSDVIYQKIFTPIYLVGGISSVVLTIDTTINPTATDNIPVSFNEKAISANDKVNVTIA